MKLSQKQKSHLYTVLTFLLLGLLFAFPILAAFLFMLAAVGVLYLVVYSLFLEEEIL